jgi:hypothetical protein
MENSRSYSHYKINRSLDKKKLPCPVFEEKPEYIDLYWKAWEIAWDHVLYREDSPQKLYIDEAMTPDTIWIWDTLFMALFCKYGFQQFPGIESLNNFYYIIHDKRKHPARIQHPDNPPFFAWVEYEYAKITGDLNRLKWIVYEKEFLQKHYWFIENSRRFSRIQGCNIPMMVKKTKFGYLWAGTPSGMDNTPRGRGKYWKILWVDLIAQQALSAYYLSLIADIFKDSHLEREYYKYYLLIKDIINEYYWDDQDNIYFDLNRWNPKKFIKVITPASFWAMLAEIPSDVQAEKMITHLLDPLSLGGYLHFPSVARKDKDFDPKGQYWRGGVWAPMVYMGIKALEKYDKFKLARDVSESFVEVMFDTYKKYTPHTIWEAYSPVESKPSTYKKNSRIVRPDFCGWSALGPVSLLIENIIGIHTIDAFKKIIHWDLHAQYNGKQGIENLSFGNINTDIIYQDGQIWVKSNQNYSLVINNTIIFDVVKGDNLFELTLRDLSK